MVECCNTPNVTFHICNSNSCHFWPCVMISPPRLIFCLSCCIFVHVMHFISCHHVHLICIRVRLMHPSIFPIVRFAIRHSHVHRHTPLVPFRVRVLNVRNGPSLAKWPWYSTGRPPVKFRVIWSSFGTPTVNRTTGKASFELQPNNPPKTAQ